MIRGCEANNFLCIQRCTMRLDAVLSSHIGELTVDELAIKRMLLPFWNRYSNVTETAELYL